jgi:cell filamentation protein, protein adenylyltransferase
MKLAIMAAMVIRYEPPRSLIKYDPIAISQELAEAKAAVMSLATIPYQRRWVEALQEVQLKREVAGTSRIEGAEFTERELDAALKETPEQLFTRSQRQARAAMLTYRWLATLPHDYPLNGDFIRSVHHHIVAGADDDHCPPGVLRDTDQNVVFGFPPHRGVNGGSECRQAFQEFCRAVEREYPAHDLLIQALAIHYHVGAMHPFLDGNGRTARAVEAAVLQRAGLRDTLIAMSNYYYDEKQAYLSALTETRAGGHDLTPFLKFGLRGIALQCQRLTAEIIREVQKALFRNVMYDLFNRLRSTRKRVIAKRQIEILKLFLEKEEMLWSEVIAETERYYSTMASPLKALVRDMNHLLQIQAITMERIDAKKILFRIRLDWPTYITETKFFEAVDRLPKGKTYSFLSEH